jgi:hypothetical protein
MVGDEGNTAGMDEKCLWCISYLCQCGDDISTLSESNCALFSDMSVIESIFSAMSCHRNNVEVVRAGCWTIRNLCLYHTNSKNVVLARGIENLCSVIRQHINTVNICEAATSALSTIFESNQEMNIGSTGVCELILSCIQHHNTHAMVVYYCSHSISTLCQKSNEYRIRFASDDGCITLLLNYKLHIHNFLTIESLLNVVYHMCHNYSENCVKFSNSEVFAFIAEVIKVYKNNENIMNQVEKVVKCLTVNNSDNIVKFEAYGVTLSSLRKTSNVRMTPNSSANKGKEKITE